ncbi:MAG: potassium-transporting ATPase subunit KdpC [Alphaproteobacteria bacterium]|nr:potassium-transporting ATPase subunit KdpC [Alphaproteobacteria bacterium]
MLTHLRPALVLFVLLAALTGIGYPLAVTGIAQAVFPAQANGSLVTRDSVVIGSSLIGQNFTNEGYFQPRPSATSAPDPNDSSKSISSPYNAAASSGSNLGPTSKVLAERVAGDVDRLKSERDAPIPVDLVTTSGSGLDPHITPAAARFQIPRVAHARDLADDQVAALVDRMTEGRTLGFIGEPRVNVLALNLALDELAGSRPAQ